jgi:hypothetical protein
MHRSKMNRYRLTADLQWIIPFNATKEDILAAGLRLQTRF